MAWAKVQTITLLISLTDCEVMSHHMSHNRCHIFQHVTVTSKLGPQSEPRSRLAKRPSSRTPIRPTEVASCNSIGQHISCCTYHVLRIYSFCPSYIACIARALTSHASHPVGLHQLVTPARSAPV